LQHRGGSARWHVRPQSTGPPTLRPRRTIPAVCRSRSVDHA
jgi:hypothetical protein